VATEKDYQGLYDRIAALREQVASRLSADLVANPQLADAITKQIDDMLASVVDADQKIPPPPDKGLAALAGVGPDAAKDFGVARMPQRSGSRLVQARSRCTSSTAAMYCGTPGTTGSRLTNASSAMAARRFQLAHAPTPTSTSSLPTLFTR
jgi:hypothetical protein